jgi:hypothetical protein
MSSSKKSQIILAAVIADYPSVAMNSVKYVNGILYAYSPDYMNGDMSTGKLFKFRMNWNTMQLIEC